MSAKSERLKLLYVAEQAILQGGQSYKIGNRTLTRADLGDIHDEISRLEAEGVTPDGSIQRSRRACRVIFTE